MPKPLLPCGVQLSVSLCFIGHVLDIYLLVLCFHILSFQFHTFVEKHCKNIVDEDKQVNSHQIYVHGGVIINRFQCLARLFSYLSLCVELCMQGTK